MDAGDEYSGKGEADKKEHETGERGMFVFWHG
jgi:hypothetical protein